MEKPTVIIEIEGGVLQRVASTVPIFYYLIDRDNIKEGDEFPSIHEYSEQNEIIPTNTPTGIINYLNSLDQ